MFTKSNFYKYCTQREQARVVNGKLRCCNSSLIILCSNAFRFFQGTDGVHYLLQWYLSRATYSRTGQWWWLFWQSDCFWCKRSLVRIQLSSCPQPSSLRRCFKGNLNRIHPGFGHTPVTKKFTFTYSENYEAENKSRWVLDAHMKTFSRAVVVAQLAEQLLPTPEVRGSNLVIGNFYWTNISY